MLKKLKNKKGFTLTELIVVIVIIGILAAVLIPTLTGYITKANKSVDEQKVASLNTLLIEAQVNEKNFEDALELKEYLEDEMDYDGDYSLKVEGSYMWYDTLKRKIVIIDEDDDKMNLSTATVKVRTLSTDSFKFVEVGELVSPEGLMKYSSGEEVWLIGGNGYLFDIVEEIRNIGNSGVLNEYKNLTDENVKKVFENFFENHIFSGTNGTYSVDTNGEVKEENSLEGKKVVEANSKNNLAKLFHNEVVMGKIFEINKTLTSSNAPVQLTLSDYNVTVTIDGKSNDSLFNAADGVLQIIELLRNNGCTVGYVIPKKYNSFSEYEEVLNEIIKGYNNFNVTSESNTISNDLYSEIKTTDVEKIDLKYMEKFYKVDLSDESLEALDCLLPVTLALCLTKNNNSYDLLNTNVSKDIFKDKDPIRLIGVFTSGKYSGLVAQYDFVFDVQ